MVYVVHGYNGTKQYVRTLKDNNYNVMFLLKKNV